MTATVESFIQEYARRYSDHDPEESPSSASMPFWPSAAADLFICPIVTRFAITPQRSWTHIEEAEQPPGRRWRSTLVGLVSMRHSRLCGGTRWIPKGLWFGTRRRRITCSRIQMAGAFSRTQIISEHVVAELYPRHRRPSPTTELRPSSAIQHRASPDPKASAPKSNDDLSRAQFCPIPRTTAVTHGQSWSAFFLCI